MSELQMDLMGGLELKKKGQALASMNRTELLEHSRKIAVMLCIRDGQTTSDVVRRAVNLPPLGSNQQNWLGALFNDARFDWTGEFTRSTIRKNHGRLIKVWRLK